LPPDRRDRTFQQPPAGLCGRCQHHRVVTSNRGATFLMCQLSAVDAAFPKYPHLPVLACTGFAADPSPQDEA